MNYKLRRLDLTGQKFGRLTVLRIFGTAPNGSTIWVCECDCGGMARTRTDELRKRKNIGCGCLRKELWLKRITKHGQGAPGKQTGAYKSFRSAKHRCTCRKHNRYKDYGGRGIKFLFKDFAQFYKELGDRPSGMTIDRINTDGNYEPGNVRWATSKQQTAHLKHGPDGRFLKIKRG